MVNAKDSYARTPLHLTVDPNIAQFLLDNGAQINAKDQDGRTPLHEACRFGRAEVVEVLLQGDADVRAKDNEGYTPLVLARQHEWEERIWERNAVDRSDIPEWKEQRQLRRERIVDLLLRHLNPRHHDTTKGSIEVCSGRSHASRVSSRIRSWGKSVRKILEISHRRDTGSLHLAFRHGSASTEVCNRHANRLYPVDTIAPPFGGLDNR